jgi:hypothetical protein
LVAASDEKNTKNPKTWTIRKLIGQEEDEVTLLWVLSNIGIPGNIKSGNAVREAFNENLDRTKEYPLQDLANWITEQHEEQQQTQWEQTGSQMRNQKPLRTKRNNTSEMKRRDQVVISRPRTGYSRATHSQIINHEPPPECPFCDTKVTTDHILWTCEETEAERNRIIITSEVCKGGKRKWRNYHHIRQENPIIQRYLRRKIKKNVNI